MANRPLIAGNWKMNGLKASLAELRAIAEAAGSGLSQACDLLICPPATLLAEARAIVGDHVALGGQDCHSENSGAHTGDIAASMLRDAGASFVIVGHSERRTDHSEDDGTVRAKANAGIASGLTAIVCIGETEGERNAGTTLDVLDRQLGGSLPDAPDRLVVAYEPVWAIGTGRTPTSDDVAAVHRFIRERLMERFGSAGEAVRILYGGSVKPSNAAELLALENVDGALVGGASLKADDFIAISRAVRPR
ncbi:triose-phosphate isomerase [Mangrovicella endophytica]|uniref:triose-phosphate isomerase n=1 Tax=Mangrovicella endophytica TaxID=2066697 RepID=UPI000C9E1AAD|nr:triose-phosphate isomerase [Mangrovicella endophytica]